MWETIIQDILAIDGYNQTRIALDIAVSKEAVSKLIRGVTKEPRYRTGARLLKLHARLRPDLYDTAFCAVHEKRRDFLLKEWLQDIASLPAD